MNNLLYQLCSIKRLGYINQNNNAFIDMYEEEEELIGYFKCRIIRQNSSLNINSINLNLNASYRCFLNIDVDIKSGDLLICEEVSYRVKSIYKPNNHHIEAEIEKIEKEV